MMKHLFTRKGVIITFFMTLIVTITTRQDAQEMVSFDSLFPQNWYTKTMQSCMMVWDALDSFIANADENPSLQDQLMMIDALIGKITFCRESLKCKTVQTVSIPEEDIVYLVRIVHSLSEKCKKLTGRHFDDKLSCLHTSIIKLRNQLYALLNTDSASFSSSE